MTHTIRRLLACLVLLALLAGSFGAPVNGAGGAPPIRSPELQAEQAGPAGTQLINGGFESGPGVGWEEYSLLGLPVVVDTKDLFDPGADIQVTPRTGDWAAWLGGADSELSYIRQLVTVTAPASALGYWHWIQSTDTCGFDVARILVDGAAVRTYSLCRNTNTGGWIRQTIDLSAYTGQTISLAFAVSTDASYVSSLYLDDIALEAAGPVTATPTASPTATATRTRTPTATATATATSTSTATAGPTATPTATGTASSTPTSTATATPTATSTATAGPTASPTATGATTSTPTATTAATSTATAGPTATPTATGTATSTPTSTATATPTATSTATAGPTATPTATGATTSTPTATTAATSTATAGPTATPTATGATTSTPTATATLRADLIRYKIFLPLVTRN
jgi:hypothetical protein